MTTPSGPSTEAELKRVVGLLLSTQQELISVRDRRDREHRVLEGIVGFTESMRLRSDKQDFWDAVVDAAVKTFDCESAVAGEWIGGILTILASRGPVPVNPDEMTRLCGVASDSVQRQPIDLLEGPAIETLRFNGQRLATLMVAALGGGETTEPNRVLLLSVSTRKKGFFPHFDSLSLPGLRMFASTIAVHREMFRSRIRVEEQVRALDRANSELERRMEEQIKSAAEQEMLRAQLAQSRRIESIGRLAGGVAHDFNNLLTVIVGYVEILSTDDEFPWRYREAITQIREASARAQALTQQLLMFSRKQVIRPATVDLNRQIEESLRLYRRLIGEDISLLFTPCHEATPVLADTQQFDQLIGNLLLNARDAIHEQPLPGRISEIRVTTELLIADSPLDGGAPAIRLTLADTGIGMTDEIRQQIFEPFFTTKKIGKGTGLGLSTVLGVVQQNHGMIEVTSEPGRGTTFQVYWPLQEAPQEVGEPVVQTVTVQGMGRERILLVEDEDQVRALMVRGLQRLGFSVTAFGSGADALQYLATTDTPPDVLVTDVVMPRMNGLQLAEAVRNRIPDLPILYVSGYTDDIVAQQGIVRDGVELLEKPFTPDLLGRRIRHLLDRNAVS